MKNAHKISTSIAIAGFLIFVGIAHADIGHIGNYPSVLQRPIFGVVTVVGDNDLTIVVQDGSTAVITSSTVEAGKTKVFRSDATALVRSVQINGKILAISAVSSANKTAKVISDVILPDVRGPPFCIKAA